MKYKLRIKILGKFGSGIGQEEHFSIAHDFKEALSILKLMGNKKKVIDSAIIEREQIII